MDGAKSRLRNQRKFVAMFRQHFGFDWWQQQLPLFLLFLLFTPIVVVQSQEQQQNNNKNNIAIIGGGIGGSFTAKYLVDYDNDCALDSIVIFEAMPLAVTKGGGTITVHDKPDAEWQGSRVTSLQLEHDNGDVRESSATSVLELGASIGHSGFHYVLEMIANDPENLQTISPLSTGRQVVEDDNIKPQKSLGIYNGHGEWTLVNDFSNIPINILLNKFRLMIRYNWDLVKVKLACTRALDAFAQFPNLLASTDPDTFFESPDAMWNRVGLQNLVHSSFAQFLDSLGVKSNGWLAYWFPFLFGSMRDELLTAINLVNYNQDTNQVNALVGLGSFAAIVDGLFSIKGGNYNLVLSAQRQANANRQAKCPASSSTSTTTTAPFVQQVEKRITTVVGSLGEGFMLYAGQEQVGQYDIVVLAAPLQMARIEFLVQSHVDESVLVPMPLGGLVDAHDGDSDWDGGEAKKKQQQSQQQHEGHAVLPRHLLPDAAKRPYTQVVTTIISNATLSSQLFGIAEEDRAALLPASILVTSAGKADLHNMTVIRRMEPGLYRTFSDETLPDSVLTKFFGPHYKLEYVKVWGGPHGGATPDYQGQGASPPFLLYDAATGLQGHTTAGALYYPSAMELSTLASMEMSAVGARAVAKLCAQRLGLLQTTGDDGVKDEL